MTVPQQINLMLTNKKGMRARLGYLELSVYLVLETLVSLRVNSFCILLTSENECSMTTENE